MREYSLSSTNDLSRALTRWYPITAELEFAAALLPSA